MAQDSTALAPLPADPDTGRVEPFGWTRFVLPFGYQLEPWSGPEVRGFKECAPPGLAERRRYLTAETSLTLFTRARWMRLGGADSPEVWQSFEAVFASGRSLTVVLDQPCLVLFEAPGCPGRDKAAHPLHTGMLLLDARLRPPAAKPDNGPHLEDLLEFNERFRFLRSPSDWHRKNSARLLAGYELEDGTTVGSGPLTDEHVHFARWAGLLNLPVHLQGATFRLFPDQAWSDAARLWLQGDSATTAPNVPRNGWAVYADERAFVWTQAGLSAAFHHTLKSVPEAAAAWVALLNVDSSVSGQPVTPFNVRWAADRTYRRWQHDGTVYGACSHAGAQLARIPAGPDPPLIHQHFRHMYFDLVLMLLYLRVGAFRFSEALAIASAQARDRGVDGLESAVRDLRTSFMLFTNLYRFPLLSNQQQAIELYEVIKRGLDVDDLFKEVQSEVQATEEFLSARREQAQTAITTKLTWIAALGLALSLGIGLYQLANGGPKGLSSVPSYQWKGVATWSTVFLVYSLAVGWQTHALTELLARRRTAQPQLVAFLLAVALWTTLMVGAVWALLAIGMRYV